MEQPIAFSHTQGLDAQPSETHTPTLRTEGNGMAVAYAIDDEQNGRPELMGTLKARATSGGQQMAVAYDQPDNPGTQMAPTLTAYNLDSRSPQSEEQQRIVSAVHSVTTIVRRLTPTECERLQGFPDDWTTQRIDFKTGQVVEQKDSSRYKQMGNAVAVPCVQWLLSRIVERMDDV